MVWRPGPALTVHERTCSHRDGSLTSRVSAGPGEPDGMTCRAGVGRMAQREGAAVQSDEADGPAAGAVEGVGGHPQPAWISSGSGTAVHAMNTTATRTMTRA